MIPPCGVVALVSVALEIACSHRIGFFRLPNNSFQHREAGAHICCMIQTIAYSTNGLNRHRFSTFKLEGLELLVEQ